MHRAGFAAGLATVICMLGLTLPLWSPAKAQAPSQIEGQPQVLDGKTFRIAGEIIRLKGIDAPDRGQACERQNERGDRVAYDCGFEAANALGFMTAHQWVQCRDLAVHGPRGEWIGRCYLGGRYDIGERLVRQGWALPAGDGVAAYADAAAEAQRARVGLWAGDFQTPWDWRARRR